MPTMIRDERVIAMKIVVRWLTKGLLSGGFVTLLSMTALLAEDAVPRDAELVQAWLKISLKHAQDYVIHPEGNPAGPFTMLPQAVFRHSQPVRGDDIGAVYLWVDADQRPAVIGTTFAYTIDADRRMVVHEFHSLASGPLLSEWRGETRWQPKKAGLDWNLVPNAPLVDANPTVRSRQVRDIARRFSANSIDEKEGRWELRLIAKPIHQFEIEKPNSVWCGSLFVLCQGTDPELVLAIEAQKADSGYIWHYGAASFTDYGLSLQLDNKEVWTAERNSIGPIRTHWAASVGVERLPGK